MAQAGVAAREDGASILTALALAGDEPVRDGLADPACLLAPLGTKEEGATVAVRAGRALDEPSRGGEDYTPVPRPTAWIAWTVGTPSIAIADEVEQKPTRAKVTGVHTVHDGSYHAVRLETELGELVVGEMVTARRDRAAEAAALIDQIAQGCASSMGLEAAASESRDEGSSWSSGSAGDLSFAQLQRFGIRREGDLVVLRDYRHEGPKKNVGKHFATSAVLAAGAIASGAVLVDAVRADASLSRILAFAILTFVVTLAAYAFFGVARFASKYTGRSRAIFWYDDEVFVVAPWLGRDGSVERRREGRFGAAIRYKELEGARVREHDQAFSVELATAHGVIDALTTPDRDVAAYWCAVLSARLDTRGAKKKSERPAEAA